MGAVCSCGKKEDEDEAPIEPARPSSPRAAPKGAGGEDHPISPIKAASVKGCQQQSPPRPPVVRQRTAEVNVMLLTVAAQVSLMLHQTADQVSSVIFLTTSKIKEWGPSSNAPQINNLIKVNLAELNAGLHQTAAQSLQLLHHTAAQTDMVHGATDLSALLYDTAAQTRELVCQAAAKVRQALEVLRVDSLDEVDQVCSELQRMSDKVSHGLHDASIYVRKKLQPKG